MTMGIMAVKAYQGFKSMKASKESQKQADLDAAESKRLAAENEAMQRDQLAKNLASQKEQQAKLETQKQNYRDVEFKNPYENLENRAEDLTVNTQQADFQAEQGQQARANIMQNLQGAAGGSGIAGLAQALAGEGQKQAQQISASIGQQEAANQKLAAQEGGRLDVLEAQGAAGVQEKEFARQSTLLGMQMGETAGANKAAQQSISNQMAMIGSQANMYGQTAATGYDVAAEQYGDAMSQFGSAIKIF